MFFEKTIISKPHNWLIYEIYIESLRKHESHIEGTVLDIGCGQKPYKKIITAKASNYFGLEHISTLHGFTDVDVLGSALQLPFRDSVVNTVVSFQVMEHIPEPRLFLEEIYRVLKPGGKCLLMTPFIWAEHEAPNDFFRYTRYGLEYLSKKAGFEVLNISADTGFWVTTIIRFNYFLTRFSGRFLKYFIVPIVLFDQFIAKMLDRWFDIERTETANFTTLLKKKDNL